MSQSESSRKHYLKNRQRRLSENKARKKLCREWLRTYKQSRSCEFCGESTTCCLDFHHLNPAEKSGNLTTLANSGWSVESLMKEVSKCILICANCHRKLHNGLLAHSGERCICNAEVAGAEPVRSTNLAVRPNNV